MINDLKVALADAIAASSGLDQDTALGLIETPKNQDHGDLAFPCFILAKQLKKAPPACASELAEKLELPSGFATTKAVGPFLNVKFDRPMLTASVVNEILDTGKALLKKSTSPKKILLEYSSPNIAKPFHVGHLRTTLIGNALQRMYDAAGHHVITVNHLGDWGTQFGFVWAGCELWGTPKDPSVAALVDLYRKATSLKERQEEQNLEPGDEDFPDVNALARDYFLKLEAKEEAATAFWQWCLDISLNYLRQTYDRLDIVFDHYIGESFYSDMLEQVLSDMRTAEILEDSMGALGVQLGEELGFARVTTPDGRSLYLTRDIAAAEYRFKTFDYDTSLYVVGAPQTLHFQQLVAILQKLGKPFADRVTHVPFGHVLGMKTRGPGGAIELNEFLDEAFDRARSAYREQVSKRPEGLDETHVAERVSHAAILFSNLARNRMKDVHFSWDSALAFQGDSGPYLLYACARVNGVREKARDASIGVPTSVSPEDLREDAAFYLARQLTSFQAALERALEENEPAHIASYALDVAKEFSRAYNALQVVGSEHGAARLALFEATRITLQKAIELLGIRTLERM